MKKNRTKITPVTKVYVGNKLVEKEIAVKKSTTKKKRTPKK